MNLDAFGGSSDGYEGGNDFSNIDDNWGRAPTCSFTRGVKKSSRMRRFRRFSEPLNGRRCSEQLPGLEEEVKADNINFTIDRQIFATEFSLLHQANS